MEVRRRVKLAINDQAVCYRSNVLCWAVSSVVLVFGFDLKSWLKTPLYFLIQIDQDSTNTVVTLGVTHNWPLFTSLLLHLVKESFLL